MCRSRRMGKKRWGRVAAARHDRQVYHNGPDTLGYLTEPTRHPAVFVAAMAEMEGFNAPVTWSSTGQLSTL